jgi:hypothetical protein
MSITASALRQNIYRLLDQVLETGQSLEIERKGQRLRISPMAPVRKLERLQVRPGYLKADPEELVHLDWSGEWRP